jgi:two-component system chemotaxis sensor kinase CheA
MDADALLAAVREAFAADLGEGVRGLESSLVALERAEGDERARLLREVFRTAHGLKGAARAAGVGPVERACHAMESLLGAARDRGRPLDRDDFAALLAAVDALGEAQRSLAAQAEIDEAPFAGVVARLEERVAAGPAVAAATATELPGEASTPTATVPTPAPTPPPGALEAVAPGEPPARARPTSLRLAPERLDALAATGGGLLVAAQAAEGRAARVDDLLAELRRARAALREGPRDPGATDGLHRVERGLVALRAQLFAESRSLARRTRRLADEVRRLRLTPWITATAGLDRVARDVGASRGKEVEVAIAGEALELDRGIVDALRDPLAQLVRNAVDHGIEPPEERRRAGKPPQGRIEIAAEVDEERVRVRVRDDGRGIDPAAVLEAARRRGLERPDDAARALDLVFLPGFSTLDEANDVSGRGVGLDVVASAVRAMRGGVSVSSEPGRGTSFELTVPATLYGLRAVLVREGSQTFAIPATDVARVVRLEPGRIRASEGRAVLAGAEPLPVAPLGHALGLAAGPWDAAGRRLALVLDAGGERAAFVVDDVVSERELSLHPLGPRLRGVALASAVAVLPSGELAIVLATHALVDAARGRRVAPAHAPPPPEAPRRRRIVLADDSATTRTLARSILEASGYEVLPAADGEQAWSLLQQHGADLVLTDVEMPRMDGFELARAVRQSGRFARLPVVLLTGLATEADRRRGLEAGADAYLVKSAFDQRELLEIVADLLEEP